MARPSARERGYGAAWERAHASDLRSHPTCVACEREGKITPATVVDHVKPHKGDQSIFWDRANWQSLCKPHHDRDKQQIETRGYAARVGADGLPTDPRHPFNR